MPEKTDASRSLLSANQYHMASRRPVSSANEVTSTRQRLCLYDARQKGLFALALRELTTCFGGLAFDQQDEAPG